MDISQSRRTSGASAESTATRKKSVGGIPASQSTAAQATSSLGLLLREDRLLTEYELHVSGKSEEVAFSYAAALLQNEDDVGFTSSSTTEVTQLATDALAEVNRKLALVESLCDRVSRTSPEAVAGPLLRLHGFVIDLEESTEEGTRGSTGSASSSLVTIRDRCDRLKRQGEVLEGVARRVETSLLRGLNRMETATSRLSRVLGVSATLKMILRLQFESSKLLGYDLEDLRDLTRAAASVAVVEDLFSRPELKEGPPIGVVESLRPGAERTAAAVRRSAASLLERHHRNAFSSSASSAVVQLGATLQVYYHLGELPQAAWKAVDHALEAVDKVSSEFWNASTLARIKDSAAAEGKIASHGSGKKPQDANAQQRMLKKKMREMRGEAASKWASGVSDAAIQVWNLHRVLCRKSDPVGRRVYVDVVAAAPIPEKYQFALPPNSQDFSIFATFWKKLCSLIANRLNSMLSASNHKLSSDVAGLYPAVRSAAIDMMGFLQDTMAAGAGQGQVIDAADGSSSASAGILGGSFALDDSFFAWSATAEAAETKTALGVTSADTWTRAEVRASDNSASTEHYMSSATTMSLSAIFQSGEWQALEGNPTTQEGLYPLQQAFLQESMQRLCAPLEYMFPEQNIALDENGLATSSLPLLPSKYDVQKFDELIRQELSLADPREGGGDLSAVKMIAGTIVSMVEHFCDRAQNALSNPGEESCLTRDGVCTSSMAHDMKVTKILYTLTSYLRQTPEKTFVAPYRPATSQQHEEAASVCLAALLPAVRQIEKMVNKILSPLVRAINSRVSSAMARVHLGLYKDGNNTGAGLDSEGPSFVQQHLSSIFDGIAKNQLNKLPPEYASLVASSVTTFSIYSFVSNIALCRPLGESSRLHITQDLADFELLLEQLVAKSGWSLSLSQIDGGKPYAELRAVRQMLFWAGLDDKTKEATSLAKAMLRESWVKDVRPSTVCHYLFSYAPTLLSSPHHMKRMKAEEYISTLVHPDGNTEDGEAGAWMTVMACCDSYQQRESVERGGSDGDPRIARILMVLGPELLRPRRH